VTRNEFTRLRRYLDKTQEEIAQLLGVSVRAVRSYEQGWRSIPGHVERQLLFLVAKGSDDRSRRPCWVVKDCAPAVRRQCPAWEFGAGDLCWFIAGTHCQGKVQANWREKMKLCRKCEVLRPLLGPELPERAPKK
jgi:hypothetical protein